MLRGLQERAARAAPAEQVEIVEGWWHRHAPGCAWWVGTVLPHGDAATADLVRRVAAVEDFYARHGATARFQISPPACPEELDAVLAERGYRRHTLVSLQAAFTARLRASTLIDPLRVQLDDRPTRKWFDIWYSVHGLGDDPRAEWDVLGRVELPCVYASAMVGDDLVAVGRAVTETGWAGVFNMATVPQARGVGAARSVLTALADWADAHQADRMYLQVERDNVPGLRLYERAGFSELCAYHYRSAG